MANSPKKYTNKNVFKSYVWWLKPIMPALRRMRKEITMNLKPVFINHRVRPYPLFLG